MPKSFPSRYPGKCKACNLPYRVGEQVVWERGVGTWHPGCAPGQPAQAPRQAPAVVPWDDRQGEGPAPAWPPIDDDTPKFNDWPTPPLDDAPPLTDADDPGFGWGDLG